MRLLGFDRTGAMICDAPSQDYGNRRDAAGYFDGVKVWEERNLPRDQWERVLLLDVIGTTAN